MEISKKKTSFVPWIVRRPFDRSDEENGWKMRVLDSPGGERSVVLRKDCPFLLQKKYCDKSQNSTESQDVIQYVLHAFPEKKPKWNTHEFPHLRSHVKGLGIDQITKSIKTKKTTGNALTESCSSQHSGYVWLQRSSNPLIASFDFFYGQL